MILGKLAWLVGYSTNEVHVREKCWNPFHVERLGSNTIKYTYTGR